MSNLETATIIRDQINAGDRRFFLCVAANKFLGGENMLQFNIGRNPKISNAKVRITLDPSDTYTVEIFKIRKFEVKTIVKIEDVYCDMLADVLNSEIG